MDVRDKSGVYVLKNCARTATAATEVIDGLTVPTGSVQGHAPLVDSGAAALSYIGHGELLITDEYGISLTAATALKSVRAIQFSQRSYDGNHFYASKALKGANITGYKFTPYEAPSQQTTIMHTIDASLADHSYMIKIRRLGTDNMKLKVPTVKTAYFKSAAGGSTAAQIATGLVAYINENFVNDPVMPVSAVVGGAANDAVIITALPLAWELGKYRYSRLKFTIELVNFNATLVNNMYGDLLYNAITYDAATAGAGNYEQVADMEYFAKAYTGANRDAMSPLHRRVVVPLDVQEFEDDGTTENRYDTIVINWVNLEGDWSANVQQQGSIVLFLPLDDNTTNQQDDVLDTLNGYIVTEYEVDSAITLS